MVQRRMGIAEFHGVSGVLVINLRHIGDVLLSVPVLRAVRERFPGAIVSALVNSGTEAALTGNSLVDDVIVFPRDILRRGPRARATAEVGFIRHIRERRFHMAVDLTSGDRAALLSFLSGARYRLAFRPRGRGMAGKRFMYTHLGQKNGPEHKVLQNLHLVRQFGIDTADLSVSFPVPEDARMFVDEVFRGRGVRDGDPVVHVHLTARRPFKCWTDRSMAEVISGLLKEGARAVVTTSPDPWEQDKARNILSQVSGVDGVIDLCGQVTLKQLGAISGASSLFLGVDSAPMHIAAAVGTPVVALFGPTKAYRWGPWANENSGTTEPYHRGGGIQRSGSHTVIQRDWDCMPCGKEQCPRGPHSACLVDITAAEILKAVLQGLGNAPAARGSRD